MRRSSEQKNDLMWNLVVSHAYRIEAKKRELEKIGGTESTIAGALDMSTMELRWWHAVYVTNRVEQKEMELMHKRELEKEDAFEEKQGS